MQRVRPSLALVILAALMVLSACGSGRLAQIELTQPNPSVTPAPPQDPGMRTIPPMSPSDPNYPRMSGPFKAGDPSVATPVLLPQTPEVVPAAATAGRLGSVRTITPADGEKTVTFKTGQRFLVAGDLDEHTVEVVDERIVSRVANAPAVWGTVGLYEAKRPGETLLVVTHDPCRKKQPCYAPRSRYRVQIVVE